MLRGIVDCATERIVVIYTMISFLLVSSDRKIVSSGAGPVSAKDVKRDRSA